MQGVDRLMGILTSLSTNPGGLGITEISEMQNLPRSTVHRILRALMEYRLVSQDDQTKKYRLGMGLLRLTVELLNQNQLRTIAMPYLSALAQSLGETVYLSVLEGDEALCIGKVDGPQGLRYFVELGRRMPFNCAASAKVLLAYLTKKKAEEILRANNLQKYTDKSIVNKEELLQHLAEVRKKGYAICDGELELGTRGIAVPIFGADGNVAGSISVVGPSQRFTEAFMERAIRETQKVALKIEEELGARAG